MSGLKVGDTVWYTDGADDRPYTISGFCLDGLTGERLALLDDGSRCCDLDHLTKDQRA